jgi:hypothetical protein
MLLTVSLSAAELSSSAERAIENFNEDLTEAVEDFEEAKQDALERLTRTLDRERSRAERSGDADIVAMIDEQIAAAQKELETAGQMTDFIGQPIEVASVNARQAQGIARMISDRNHTADQWDTLGGSVYTVEFDGDGVSVTDITVSPDQRFLIVPHPTDAWGISNPTLPEDQWTLVGYDGLTTDGNTIPGKTRENFMVSWVVSEDPASMIGLTTLVANPIVTTETEGNIILRTRHRAGNTGSIRVKIILVE